MAEATLRTKRPKKQGNKAQSAAGYKHPEASALLKPDVGIQAQFCKQQQPTAYRYDSSLSPELNWDEQPTGREKAEEKIAALQGQ